MLDRVREGHHVDNTKIWVNNPWPGIDARASRIRMGRLDSCVLYGAVLKAWLADMWCWLSHYTQWIGYSVHHSWNMKCLHCGREWTDHNPGHEQ